MTSQTQRQTSAPHPIPEQALDSEALSLAYDELGYDSGLVLRTHPCELGGVAALFGVSAPPVHSAKILEVGSALGQNLSAIASSLPNAVCVGVDLSVGQVEQAQREAEALGLSNVVYLAANILELREELRGFDYIICHGVYSWIPSDVREALLPTLCEMLAPTGLLYLSYNTLPGWADCGLIRGLAQSLAPGRAWSADQVSGVDQWIRSLPRGGLRRRYEQLWFESFRDQPTFYQRHGVFAEFNEPRLFREVTRDADTCGLTYVTDVSLARDLPSEEERASFDLIPKLSRVERIQLLDFARHTTFRASIFTQSAAISTPLTLQLSSLSRLSVCAHLVPLERDQASQDQSSEVNPDGGVWYQGRAHALSEPTLISSPLLIDLISAANQSWPAPLPLKPYLDALDPAYVTSLVGLIVIALTHEHLSVYLDSPELTPYVAPSHYDPDYPQLSPYNLRYVKHGRDHLIQCGLHRATSEARAHPWFLFSDLFNGARNRASLIMAVSHDPRYKGSALSKVSEAELRSSLDEAISLFRRCGLI